MGLYTQVSDVCQATQACLYAGFYWGWGLGGETYAELERRGKDGMTVKKKVTMDGRQWLVNSLKKHRKRLTHDIMSTNAVNMLHYKRYSCLHIKRVVAYRMHTYTSIFCVTVL